MSQFSFPKSFELMQIGPAKVARATTARVGLQILPVRAINAATIRWTQKDNYRGLQQLRGLDGSPSLVKRVGSNTYTYDPGVYGEFLTVGETELTTRAGSSPAGTPIDVSDLVLELQDQLIQRELDLQEYIVWQLLITGAFTIALPGGVTGYAGSFAIQTHSGSDWSNLSAATPLKDFRDFALLSTGKGVNFGSAARARMNRVTANYLLNNTNANDLGGKLTEGGRNLNLSLADINKVLVAQDVPQIEIYDEGYYDDSNNFQYYIPTDKVSIVGARTSGEKVGEYLLTRNAVNTGMAAGSYDVVIDKTGNGPDGQKRIPPSIDVHRGHNGGPVIYFPSALGVMSI